MLDKGFIRELTLLATVLLLLAIKPGGSVQICYNYRGLNIVTIKNRYLLPLVREILDALYSAKYFTKCHGTDLTYTVSYCLVLFPTVGWPTTSDLAAGPTICIQYPLSTFFPSSYHNVVIQSTSLQHYDNLWYL